MGMRSLFTGLSGLMTAQLGSDLTAHNIANVNTPNYSRQVAILDNTKPVSMTGQTSKWELGTGVTLRKIDRYFDKFIEARRLLQTSSVGYESIKDTNMKEIEGSFNEPGENGFSTAISDFFDALQNLSTNPDSLTMKNALVKQATQMTYIFNNLYEGLTDIQQNVASDIQDSTDEINTLTAQIADYNKDITGPVLRNENVGDLMDKRDNCIEDLAKLININVTYADNGVMNISTGGRLIVANTESVDLYIQFKANQLVDVFYTGETNPMIPSGGKLAGLIELQDTIIPNLKDDIDDLALGFMEAINRIHTTGISPAGAFAILTSSNLVADDDSSGDPTNDQFVNGGTLNSGLPFKPVDGQRLYINATSSLIAGSVTQSFITVNQADTLTTLAAKLTAVAGITATANTSGSLTISLDPGYSSFDFSTRLDPNPDDAAAFGAISPSVSGIYTGTANDTYTFTANGAGTIGVTNGLKVNVTNGAGATIATLDVGAGYVPGTELEVKDGVRISFGEGTLAGGENFDLNVLADSDPSDILSVLGINTFFNGTDSRNITVNPAVENNVNLIASGSTLEKGDNSNLLKLIGVRTQKVMQGNTATLEDAYNLIVGDIGNQVEDTSKAQDVADAQLQNMNKARQNVSGVDINEELANLIRYQTAFQASAKVISIVNLYTQTLINMF